MFTAPHLALQGAVRTLCFLLFSVVMSVASAQLTVTSTTGSIFPYDSNKCATTQGPRAMYIGYTFTATTNQTNLKATLTTSGAGFGLAGRQGAEQYLGSLAAGASRTLFWYVTYPCVDQASGTMTVTIQNDATNALVQTYTGTYATSSMLSANAGADPRLIVNVAGAVVGQIISRQVTFKVGNIGSNNTLLVEPAGNLDFDASCLQLIGTKVESVNLVTGVTPGTQNILHFSGVSSGGGQNNEVVMTYDFLYTGLCASEIKALPFSYSGSGTQIKYMMSAGTDPATYFTFPASTNALTISKQVEAGTGGGTPASSTELLNGGTVTYTVTIRNSSAYTANLGKITDVLPVSPGAVTYVGIASGSGVTAANSMITPAPNTSSATQPTLVFRPLTTTSYQIAPNSSLILKYTVTIPVTPGIYDNSATGGVAATTVYTTTTGTTPAKATVNNVALANLGLTKTFSPSTIIAGNTTTLTLTLNNPNAADATGVSLTDNVAATMGYPTPMLLRVTANTCGGTTSANVNTTGVLTLTGVSLPASRSCTLTVAFTPWGPPLGTATNQIPAANVSATVKGTTVTGTAASAALTVTAGNAGSGYVCTPDFFQIRQDPVTLLTNLYKLDLNNLGSGGTLQWSEGFGPALNGMAYNHKDGYFYAVNITPFNTGSPFRLYRLGRSGAVEYASLTNIPAGSSIAAATVDRNGVMYIKKLQQDSVIYRYDLVGNRTLSTLTLNASVYLWDLAINPLDNQMYGAVTPGGVYVIDPSTGAVVLRGTPAALAADNSNAVGTLFFNYTGTLYAYQNGGAFGTINTTTGAFTRTALASAAEQSDGASCAFQSPDLTLIKTASAAYMTPSTPANAPVAAVDRFITYTLTVRNIAQVPTSGAVSVADALPQGLTATSLGGTDWTCTLATLSCTRSDALVAGGSYPDITLVVRAPYTTELESNAGLRTITNSATVSGGGEANTSNNTGAANTTMVYAKLTKTVRNVSVAGAVFGTASNGRPGQTLQYCIEFVNYGGGTLSNFKVNDAFPPNTTFVPGSLIYASPATSLSGTSTPPANQPLPTGVTYAASASGVALNLGVAGLAAGGSGMVCFSSSVN